MRQLTPASLRRARGFTLIEIAMVMVVIGLMLSGGLMAVGPVLTSTRVSATEQSFDKVETALRLYAIRYGCLPCPADGDIATGDANYGAAEDGAGVVAGECATNAACRADAGGDSVVPWITLGLTEADATDGWGNRITYYLSPGNVHLENTVDASPCPTVGTETAYTNGICRARGNYPPVSLQVNDAAGSVLTNPNNQALYVLISHGPNGFGARQAGTGTSLAAPTETAEDTNASGVAPFVQNTPIDIPGTYFDDIVRWRSAPAFIQSCGAGACGN